MDGGAAIVLALIIVLIILGARIPSMLGSLRHAYKHLREQMHEPPAGAGHDR